MKDFIQRIRELPQQKLVLLAAQLQERLEKAEAKTRDEPIAVIGVGCRFPGGAEDPESYWQMLLDGVDAIQEVPPDRWDAEAFYDPNWQTSGKMATKWGSFLQGVDLFDARLFGVSPREAVSMDPQQRLVLETAWQAIERAGIAPGSLAGSSTGVFVGICNNDYQQIQLRRGLDAIDGYLASGSLPSVAAGRIAYVLGLQGPTMSVDTACSSSLVAVHLAVQALRNRECNAALAAGVNTILSPVGTIALSQAQMMAPDGRCRAFAAGADGFVRGEGCGVVLLKRLSDAQHDGDKIVGVIRGSAVNHDGRSNGLTAPNGPSQEAVIRAALASGGVDPAQVGYVEAHGTGTALGDPIEVQALGVALANGSNRTSRLQIGSVKTNIGHLESAAGIAGLIKTLLILEHGTIPPHLHLERKSEVIQWNALPIDVPTAVTPWPSGQERVAGVSSFGVSGTNAHVVLEASPTPTQQIGEQERKVQVLTLSAQSSQALDALARHHGEYLATHEVDLADFCHTLNLGRDAFAYRESFVAQTVAELKDELLARGRGSLPRHSNRDHLESRRTLRPVWLFTGQGAQYGGMGRELYESEPVFAAVLNRCDLFLREKYGLPLLDVILADDDPRIHQTQFTQPALFAIEVALAALWQSWGVEPGAVMGHSVGEYSAACVAGLFDLEDGLAMITERGRLMQALPAGGRMVAVFAPADIVGRAIAPFRSTVSIAAVNGPESVVISGEAADVQAALDALGPETVSRELEVSHAFHSPAMDGIVSAFGSVAENVRFQEPQIPIVSNLDGRPGNLASLGNAGYWQRHIRDTVQFAPAMSWLAEHGHRVFLEIGPQPTLVAMAARWLDEPEFRWVASLRRDRSDYWDVAAAIGALWTAGVSIDWNALNANRPRQRLIAPTYPLQRERFWVEGVAPWDAVYTAPSAPASADVDKMLYEVEWKISPRSVGTDTAAPLQSTAPQRWVVVGDGTLSKAVTSELTAAGSLVTSVAGDNRSEFTDLDLRGAAGLVLVIEPHHADTDDEPLTLKKQRHERRVVLTLNTVNALLARAAPPHLWLVTQAAQAIDGPPLDAEAATSWGISHVIEAEHPELHCRRIDLAPGSATDAAKRLIPELLSSDVAEPRLAFRGEDRFVPRLHRSPVTSGEALVLNPEASYLVSGGLRGIGLRVVAWLVEKGARNLVVFGRSQPSVETETGLQRLREQGAAIVIECADASDEVAMQRVVESARALAPLRGVIHAAGVLADAALMGQDWPHFDAVFAPKVWGSQALLRHIQPQDLDFLVLFSSGAGVVGSPGQANYAAANAYLDALAAQLKGQGVPAISIDWGAWKNIGSAAKLGLDKTPDAFTPEQGLAALERIIVSVIDGRAPAQVAVHSGQWAHQLDYFAPGSEPSLFRDLFGELRAQASFVPSTTPTEVVTTTTLRDELHALSDRRRRLRLRDEVRSLAARVLDIADAERIEAGEPLHDMGLNSLMAIELRNLLARAIGVALPATLLFEHPSVNALAGYLLAEYLEPDAAAALGLPAAQSSIDPDAGPPPPDRTTLDDLDDDEFADALSARLDRLAGKGSS